MDNIPSFVRLFRIDRSIKNTCMVYKYKRKSTCNAQFSTIPSLSLFYDKFLHSSPPSFLFFFPWTISLVLFRMLISDLFRLRTPAWPINTKESLRVMHNFQPSSLSLPYKSKYNKLYDESEVSLTTRSLLFPTPNV